MASPKLYLKQNVLVEPLFNQWYAWSYLISPLHQLRPSRVGDIKKLMESTVKRSAR
jgi:hypothetical protein